MVIPGLDDALVIVREAQKNIDQQVKLIGQTLDGVLLNNDNFNHLSLEQLEFCVSSLPYGCFYAVDLKREWRRRREAIGSATS
jgi:hypothetical protein